MEPVLKPPSPSFILIFVSRSKNQLAPLYTFQNWNPSLLICIIHDVTRCRPFGRDRSFTLDASIHAILNLTGFAILAPLVDEEKIARRGPISRRPLIMRYAAGIYVSSECKLSPYLDTPFSRPWIITIHACLHAIYSRYENVSSCNTFVCCLRSPQHFHVIEIIFMNIFCLRPMYFMPGLFYLYMI